MYNASTLPGLNIFTPFPKMSLLSYGKSVRLKRKIPFCNGLIKVRSPQASAFFWAEPLENLNSLGLRYRDALIGWIVTHRMNPETIRYTALYCDPSHRAKGDIIKLLIQSIKLQQQTSIPRSLFEINHQLVEPKRIDFVQQPLASYAQDVLHKQILWTHLNELFIKYTLF